MNHKRNLVFISHENPKDNTFTIWLSTRLKLLGYEVWSDVTMLYGGEKWWNDIEDAINNYTCKFILVITRSSLSKPGVKREINLALKAEKTNKLPNFIVPIIIDDSLVTNQPYDLSQRNILQFENNWAAGFATLTEGLVRSNVETKPVGGYQLSPFISLHEKPKVILKNKSQPVLGNWLNIESIPDYLDFYKFPVKISDHKGLCDGFPCPWFEYSGLFATFANLETVQGFFENWASKIEVASTLSLQNAKMGKGNDRLGLAGEEAAKKINFMLSIAWDRAMKQKGLRPYKMANDKTAWFFPYKEPYIGRLRFPDIHGESRTRSIAGKSEANKVFWHFCLSAKPLFGKEAKFCLSPHVVFTEDGFKPIEDPKRMHRLRRRFCKMWWNARWRDLLLLYLYLLCGDEMNLLLPVGSNQKIVCSSRPLIMDSPVSLEAEEEIDDEAEPEDVLIDLVIDDEEDFDDDLS